MGKKIVISGFVSSDDNAPVLATIDPIESAGSLYLLDASRSLASGVPADTAPVTNLFAANLGSLAAGATSPTLRILGDINDGTKGHVERSGKDGLHVIVSQASSLASGDGVCLRPAAALAAYLNANNDHDYYISVWDRLTRAYAGAGGDAVNGVIGAATTAGLAYASHSGWGEGSGVTLIAESLLGNVVGERRAGHAGTGSAGSLSSSNGSAGPVWGAPTTTFGGGQLATHNTKWSSFVFYRVYVEDLTVSGRTYAEVDAIDAELFLASVLTPGGRYYGDTFTDPTTLP